MDAKHFAFISQQLQVNDRARIGVTSAGVEDGRDRTLIYGYDTDRNTHHIYLQDGLIHRFIYRGWFDATDEQFVLSHAADKEWAMADLIPNKRIFPEASDYIFCQVLVSAGQYLSFKPWTDEIPEGRRHTPGFSGLTYGSTLPKVS